MIHILAGKYAQMPKKFNRGKFEENPQDFFDFPMLQFYHLFLYNTSVLELVESQSANNWLWHLELVCSKCDLALEITAMVTILNFKNFGLCIAVYVQSLKPDSVSIHPPTQTPEILKSWPYFVFYF